MHVTVWEANERAGNAATGPENHVGIRAARRRHRLMLEGDFVGFCNLFDPGDYLRMITAAMRERRPAAHSDISMLRLVDRRVIRRVGHIHDQRDIWFE